MIKEIHGRWTCTKCGYEWSAMISDDEVPDKCECELHVKTFLVPRAFRRGQPTLTFITKDRSVVNSKRFDYALGTYWGLVEPKLGGEYDKIYQGEGREYSGSHRIQISAELYNSLLKESKRLHKKYTPRKKQQA